MSSPTATEAQRTHFEVEKELAARLRTSRRSERPQLVPQLYSELYERVPDHPRHRAQKPEVVARKLEAQMRLLRPFLSSQSTLVEIAAGDGSFAKHVAPHVSRVLALEICDQRAEDLQLPENVEMHLFDGYECALADGVADIAFSYQLIEHIHPEDVGDHLALASRLLKSGGVYVLSTPHGHSGPHDISRCFGSELQTFHLHEWTLGEMSAMLKASGFSRIRPFFRGKLRRGPVWLPGLRLAETVIGALPTSLRLKVARKAFNNVVLAAWKN